MVYGNFVDLFLLFLFYFSQVRVTGEKKSSPFKILHKLYSQYIITFYSTVGYLLYWMNLIIATNLNSVTKHLHREMLIEQSCSVIP